MNPSVGFIYWATAGPYTVMARPCDLLILLFHFFDQKTVFFTHLIA